MTHNSERSSKDKRRRYVFVYYSGHGLFTCFMLTGIKNEELVNPDGSIKVDDLFGYLTPPRWSASPGSSIIKNRHPN